MEPTLNLLIVHTPGAQQLSDWLTVKEKIEAKAPDIEVRIVENKRSNPIARKWQVRRPSMVFSPTPIQDFRPLGGAQYVGQRISKIDQAKRLSAAGVETPRSISFLAGMVLKQEVWGEYVIVKPVDPLAQRGEGVRLVRTTELNARLPTLLNVRSWAGDSMAVGSRLMVQQFVDHADNKGHLVDYRALMFDGRPLYLQRRRGTQPRRPIAELANELSGQIASNYYGVQRRRKLVIEDEVLDLASRASAVFPEVPALGVDIIREHGTGKLFVLEVNPNGTWHLSSTNAMHSYSEELRRAVYQQFNALDVVADVLIEKTRKNAR